MANDFLDTLSDVDVVSDGENIKKLLKIPYSKTPVSMVVHRVGKTLLLDDFDVHRYLMRRSASEWEWIRKFFTQTILQETGGAVVRKNASNTALQERNLVSKFLYRSLENTLEGEVEEKVEDEDKAEVTLASLSLETLPPLPDPAPEKSPNFSSEKFARNLLWNFEDIRMLIGSNMPIFGDREHPCVSLRLRDMKKPINVLTGMDYWLDNLMCQVPEVVMCYHLDGLVQKYELVKTEDLPNFEGSKFSPKVVKNIAQNILHFLKSKAAKEGHTYWLFKGKDDDIVKLYDLTSLSQKDAGIKPENCAEDVDPSAGMKEEGDVASGNPFQTPVSMLLYRLARNILETEERSTEEGTVRELLQNCVSLLDVEKFPHIATSAHFLLSELYVPEGTDPAQPSFGPVEDPTTHSDSSSRSNEDDGKEDIEVEDGEEQSSLRVATLCLPSPLGDLMGESRSPPISATVADRCHSALKHLASGLTFLSDLEARREAKVREEEKSREMAERENIRMSVPNTAIPMGYTSNPATGAVVRSRSVSEGSPLVPTAPASLTWTEYLKFLVLKKALLVYITLAEVSFSSLALGRSLKCVKRAVNCFSLVSSLGSPEDRRAAAPGVSFALGVAGDCYMACVARWPDMPVYQEQYNTVLQCEGGIAKEVERYTHELERDWTIKQPKDIQEAMELAVRCYGQAIELYGSKDGEEVTSLQRRLANVENELGVFYMNQATALVQRITEDQEELAVPAMAGAQDLFSFSRKYLDKGVARFQGIADLPNTALLLSNSGRLSRLAGHAAGLAHQESSEVSEFGGEEAKQYREALDYYHQALAVLGSRKVSPEIWDSVTWELSSTLYTVGTLLQDHAPLSSQSREEVEKSVTEHMSQALRLHFFFISQIIKLMHLDFRYIDYDSAGPRQQVFLLRGGVIHHRLASLYHHSYRCYGPEDSSPRKKKLRQLSDLHYVKAAGLFLTAERYGEYLRTVLERAGLAEAPLANMKSDSARQKGTMAVLEVLVEVRGAVASLAAMEEAEEERGEEGKEEVKMLETLVQRIQFILLSLIKLDTSKKSKNKKADNLKDLYAASLKCSGKSAKAIHQLLVRLVSERLNLA